MNDGCPIAADVEHAVAASLEAHTLQCEAAATLAGALAHASELHLPGVRDRHRIELERAIELARAVLAAAENGGVSPKTIAGARSTWVTAHAARAQDARHGAGQLSRAAQRAPTRDA